MRLKSVHIENFRCFESLEMDLDPSLNVIIGINGAGKSSVLDAITMGLQPLADWLVSARDQGSFKISPKDIRQNEEGKTASSAKITLCSTDNLVWSDERRRDSRVSDSEPLGRQVGGSNPAPLRDRFHAVRKAISADENADHTLPVFAYYRTGRNVVNMPNITNPTNARFPRLTALRGSFDASAEFQSVVSWFNAKENQELRSQRKRKDLSYALPELDSVRQAVLSLIEPAEEVFFSAATPPQLTLRWHEGGRVVDRLASQLSDGYRNMLALVMDFARRLAQANPQLAKPLEAEAILLIDEIDLHLHPGWQQTVLQALKRAFPETQIIATTHSPQIISTVRPENIRILEANGTCSVPEEHTYGAESSRVLAEIFEIHPRPDVLTKEIDEYVTLVEAGQADSDRALELRRELENALGNTDPLLINADIRRQVDAARAS